MEGTVRTADGPFSRLKPRALEEHGLVKVADQRQWGGLTERLLVAPADAPPLAGIVEEAGEHRQVLLRLDQPAPGIAHLFALPMSGQVYLPIRLYLYGEGAAAVVAREEPLWNAWMKERFAPAGEAQGVA